MIEANSPDIIHPRERFVALPLYDDSNLRDLTIQTGNVQKTPFPFGCPYKWCSQPLDSIDIYLARPDLSYLYGHFALSVSMTGLVDGKITQKK